MKNKYIKSLGGEEEEVLGSKGRIVSTEETAKDEWQTTLRPQHLDDYIGQAKAKEMLNVYIRAARNSEGHVIMYADKITDSMKVAIDETARRRKVQQAYNEEHGITPQTIQKSVRELIAISKKVAADEMEISKDPESMSKKELEKLIADIQKKMKKAAAELNFEAAAEYRDRLIMLKNTLRDID